MIQPCVLACQAGPNPPAVIGGSERTLSVVSVASALCDALSKLAGKRRTNGCAENRFGIKAKATLDAVASLEMSLGLSRTEAIGSNRTIMKSGNEFSRRRSSFIKFVGCFQA